jgi:tRNA pseudouridine38/39 synthase
MYMKNVIVSSMWAEFGDAAVQESASFVSQTLMDTTEQKLTVPTPASSNKRGRDEQLVSDEEPRKQKQKHNKKKVRDFNWDRWHFRHIALNVMYFGESFHGFCTQNVTVDDIDTVEKQLFRALETTKLIVDYKTSGYSRCGRTDKGVSAMGQVIGVWVRSNCTSGIGVYQQAGPVPGLLSEGQREFNEDGTCNYQIGRKDTARNDLPSTNSNNTISSTEANDDKEEIDYALILNKVLPAAIRVVWWAPVPTGFSARFSCSRRTYKYLFYAEGLDIEAMQAAANHLVI